MSTVTKNKIKKAGVDFATRLAISRAVAETLNDPDFGLQLTARAKKILAERRNYKGRYTDLSEIKKRYSLK